MKKQPKRKRVRRHVTARPVSRSLRPPSDRQLRIFIEQQALDKVIEKAQIVLPREGSFDPDEHYDRVAPFQHMVAEELARARTKNGPLHSTHEAFGVVFEEGAEWFLEIMANNAVLGLKELIQVAAMCQRAAEDVYRVEP